VWKSSKTNRMDPQKFKGLQVRKTQLESELRDLRDQLKELDKKILYVNSSLSRISKEMNDLNEQQPTISEHALLRYVERIEGVDLEKIKREILSEANIKIISQLRSCKLPIGKKYTLVVRNKVVVTVEDC